MNAPVDILDSDEEEDQREAKIKELVSTTQQQILAQVETLTTSACQRLSVVEADVVVLTKTPVQKDSQNVS